MPKHINFDLEPDFQHFLLVAKDETDRAYAILAGVFIDNLLAHRIRERLIDDKSVDALFDRGPLATFFARIDVAFAMGLLGPTYRDDLHCVREIRNHFAHHMDADFEKSPVAEAVHRISVVRDLMNPKNRVTLWREGDEVPPGIWVKETTEDEKREHENQMEKGRTKFSIATAALSTVLGGELGEWADLWRSR